MDSLTITLPFNNTASHCIIDMFLIAIKSPGTKFSLAISSSISNLEKISLFIFYLENNVKK